MRHSNRASVDSMPQHDCLGIDCQSMDSFIIVEGNNLIVNDNKTLKSLYRIFVEIPFNKSGFQNKILNLRLSQC